ncbi:MAG: ATP-dependent DNA helicase [Actinomycetota bacterium]|nr:ATP-dependent DNA helicase [Actinomycetota bacterium]
MTRKKKPASSPDASWLSALFAEAGPLASRKSGYGFRPQQLGFARAVAKTFEERGVLLADAPTGTGKSAAYLAPAILDVASSSGGRVVVSTATLALQAQLLSEDLPPMKAAAAELMGYPEEEGITYAVLKGRSNFLCVRRHQDTLRAGTILDADLISNLDLWAAETETGDREDLTFRVPVGPWVEVASDGEDCAPKLCTFREGCFYYAHRDRAEEADLVVVNHSLLLANAASGGAIFGTEGAHLVIDEAHRLEEVMAETFGARVSYGRVRYVMRQAKKRCESAGASADRAEMAAELFFADLGSGASVLHKSPPRSYDALVNALISVRNAIASDPREEVNALQGMVGRLRRDLVSFYSKPDEDYAYAVIPGRNRRAGGRSYPELKSWLVETAEVFRENVLPLFEDGGVVLTSATLATGSGSERSFGYVRRRLGLDEGGSGDRVEEFAGEEVFDYEERCLVYVEEEIAAPTLGTPDIFARSCARRAEELVGFSEGRALVLLSTNRALAAFREHFRPPYPVRYQGDDSPGRLIRWLKETDRAILVGTRTFWEGVDVPGPSVSLVVMDRVPFAPPDDPVAARLREKAGERAFREVFLPKAQVAVRQGAGRLMRRAADRGVVALLDPRVASKGWGRAILKSLPPAGRTGSLAQVARFFAEDPREDKS